MARALLLPSWLLLLPLALLGRAEPARAAPPSEAPSAEVVDLSGARVLASPGWPAALEGFLPARRAPGGGVETLAVPLPPGPLLVLGLASDPVARALGETLLGLDPDTPLLGGYVAQAWRAGGRSLALVLAADAAALAAARFELETFTPAELEGAPRSVDVTQPDEQAGVRMAAGRRSVHPRLAWRGATGLGPEETALDLAAAHANRVWIDGPLRSSSRGRFAEHGVLPVVALAAHGDQRLSLPRLDDLDSPPLPWDEAVALARAWQRAGVRCFALERAAGEPPSEAWRRGQVARALADALRPGGLDELLVLESEAGGDRPDLRAIPEALLGWRGPRAEALTIPRAEAERTAREAGVPVVLVEDWARAQSGEPPRLPVLPRGRAADLGDVLEGVLVLAGPGSAEILASAWLPPADDAPSAELAELLGACALHAPEAAAFLTQSAELLEAALAGRLGVRGALARLPQLLRAEAERLPPLAQVLRARHVPEPVQVDGRLDDRAWAFALPARLGPVDVLALSDGRRLVLGLRLPDDAAVASVRIDLVAPSGLVRSASWPDPRTAVGADPPERLAAEVRQGRRGAARELEVALEHYDLGGAAYPTRSFALDVIVRTATGEFRLAPPGAPEPGLLGRSRPRGALVVVR